MKRASWYLTAGAVAGFAGVLGLSSRTAAVPVALKGSRPAQAGQQGHSNGSGGGTAAGNGSGGSAAGGNGSGGSTAGR